MTLELVFLGCFGFGLIMSAFSFLSGAVDFGADTDFDGVEIEGVDADMSGTDVDGIDMDVDGGDLDADAAKISTFNFSAVMAFLGTFGGAGYILAHFYGVAAVLSVPTAMASGVAGASLINLFLTRILVGRDRTLKHTEMVGTVGRLSLPIRDAGIGELVYSDGGSIHSTGARSLDDRAIEKGAEVMIVRYEKGIAYVRRLEEVLPGVEQAVRRIESASAQQVSRRIRTTLGSAGPQHGPSALGVRPSGRTNSLS